MLIVPEGGRFYVIPFGHGRHKIPDRILEPRFGRLVTLNALDPKAVRVIENLKFDGTSRNSRTQVAQPASLLAFDLQPSAEIVKSLGGRAQANSFAKRISGSTFAQVTAPLGLSTLRTTLVECHKLFSSKAYRKELGWIDQIEIVNDPTLAGRLDAQAMKLVVAPSSTTSAWFSIPEVVEWDDFSSFSIRGLGKTQAGLDDLFRQNVIDALAGAKPTPDLLQRGRVYMKRTSHPERSWSVYNCLYAEVVQGTTNYILHDGQWYQIENNLVASVNATVKSLTNATLTLPPWPDGDHEATFNAALAAANAGAVLGDKKLVRIGGSPIEVCDVLCRSGELVHVKHYKNSATLSHLFAQGLNSAEALADASFRSDAASELKAPQLNTSTWSPGKHPVVYVIGSRSSKTAAAINLPFFSKLTLHNCVRRLRGMQHAVHLNGVHIH